jgi:hypothetical protein
MNCQCARESFPELLDPRTAATAHLEARAHLANCPDCQRDFAALRQTLSALDTMSTPQPSPRLRKNFYAMLEEEKHSAASVRAVTNREQRARRVTLWRWVLSPLAAAALLFVAFKTGQRSVAPVVRAAESTEVSMRGEIAALREQVKLNNEQMTKVTQLVGYSILQQQQNPVNERLQEVLAAAKSPKPDAKVLDDLISAVAFDPSVNVRLRALEALYQHADQDVVRAGVLASLPREQNPLVQLEMIDFVASAHDSNAAPVLEKLAQNELIDRSVRDAARTALAQL